MLIIGCDFHPGFQQVAIFDNRAGESKTLSCQSKTFYESEMALFVNPKRQRRGVATKPLTGRSVIRDGMTGRGATPGAQRSPGLQSRDYRAKSGAAAHAQSRAAQCGLYSARNSRPSRHWSRR
jgi:hypothetical protein